MTSGSMWGVVIPLGGRNLLTNPSGELGTTGWESVNSANIGSFSDRQAFGAWSVRMSSTGLGTQGVRMGTYTAAAGGTYTLSVHILGRPGSVYVLGPQNIATGGFAGGSVVTTANGSWQRLSVMYGEASSVNRGLLVAARDTGHTGAWWADGAQVEAGTYVTTYIDGDQDGCLWEGAPHASPSTRLSDQRGGGTMVPLAAIGLRPETTPGAGMPPTLNQLQSYAIADGGAYQRTRYESRTLTITATMTGTSYGDLAQTRRRVIDALKAGRAPTPAPARLVYWGAGGTVTLDALYSEGLDGAYDNVVSEVVAARFVAPDPAWTGLFDEGTSLAPYTVLGSTNFIAYRDPAGRWGTMGPNGSGVNGTVYALEPTNGSVFVGGTFNNAGGTTGSGAIAIWGGATWGTTTGGVVPGTIYALRYQAGTLFAGGRFNAAGGTTARAIAQWANGAWGTLTGGTLGDVGLGQSVFDFAVGPAGQLIVAGEFTGAFPGTVSFGLLQWNGAWGSFPNGTVNDAGGNITAVYGVARSPGDNFAIGGDFVGANGTTARGLAVYQNGNMGTWGAGQLGTPIYDVAYTPDGQLYGITTNGTVFSATPGGVSILGGVPVGVSQTFGPNVNLTPLPDGRLIVAPVRQVGGTFAVPFGYAVWNGYSFLPPDIRVSAQGTLVFAVAQDAAGTRYVGGAFNGIGTAASVASVVNRGMDNSYPVLRVRHDGVGTARIYQLLNTSTGDEIYFNLVMIPGERVVLDLRPESLSFTSDVKGTIISTILGGSNLSTWRLAPGTNTVSFFADNAGVQASLYWRPRHLSADGGADPTI